MATGSYWIQSMGDTANREGATNADAIFPNVQSCNQTYTDTVKKHTKAGLTSANNAGLFCSTARRHVIKTATYSDWHK